MLAGVVVFTLVMSGVTSILTSHDFESEDKKDYYDDYDNSERYSERNFYDY